MRRLASASLLLLSLACSPAEPRASARPLGKRELYGDPALVPTREGERARRELMLAAELERLLGAADIAASVGVSLVEPGSALIVAHDDDEARVRAIARASLPTDEVATIEFVHAPIEPTPAPARSPLPAVFVALALGVSLGVLGERARVRGSFSAPRSRS